jgi:hypothetical protein
MRIGSDCLQPTTRVAFIGLVTVAAGLAADLQAASAQNESFFQKRYCARRVGTLSQLGCSYDTLEQCNIVFEPTRFCMRTHGGTDLADSRQRKSRKLDTIVRPLLHADMRAEQS